jgi:Iap family predicted aminopeptidase
MNHLKYLVDEIGTRAIGTESNHRATQYIRDVFEGAGLYVTAQRFHCPLWTLRNVFIEQGSERFDATANAFTQGCDVTAPTVPISTITELDRADLCGKIAVLYGDVAKERFMPRAFTMFQPERHVSILRRLEEKRPVAIVFVYKQIAQRLSLITDWLFPIPSVTVTPEVGLRLIQNDLPLRIKIDSETTNGYSENVIGRKRNVSGEKRVVLCAHYDTHFESPGAMDNGSGVAVLLALAQAFARKDLDINLEFIAFSGEEYAALGDQAYLDSQPDFDSIVAVVNIDGVGQALGNTTVTTIGTSEHVTANIRAIAEEFPGVTWVDPWYASNHTTFVFQGVPAIAISSLGVENLIDGPQDELKWVSEDKLEEAARLVLRIVESIRDR